MAYQQDERRDPLTGRTTGGAAGSGGSAGGSMGSSSATGTATATGATGLGDDFGYGGADRIDNERDDSRSAAIERDIDRTRSRMDRTVEDLTQRLRPGNLVGDLLDYFGSDEGTRTERPQADKVKRVAGRAGRGVWEHAKANPMASALIAGGIAWMFLKGDDDGEAAPRGRGRSYGGSYEGGIDYGRDYGMRQRILRNSREPEMYGGSYVDARTGQPYDVENYGRDYRGGYRDVRGMGYEDEREQGPGMGDKLKHAAGWVAEKAGGAVSGAASALGSAASSAAGAIGSAAGGAAQTVGDAAGHAAARTGGMMRSGSHAVGGAASGTWESTRHGMSRGASRTGEWSRSAWRGTRRGARQGYAMSRDRFEHGISEYPLAMGVAALAAGVLAGLAAPRTRREDRLFGRTSHDLKNRVGSVANEAWRRGREAAGDEGLDPNALRDEARGLGGRLSEAAGRVAEAALSSAKDVAGNVAEAVKSEAQGLKQEAKDKGLTPAALAGSAKSVAKEAARGARDEAGHQTEDLNLGTSKSGGASSTSGASGGAFTSGGISTIRSDGGSSGGSSRASTSASSLGSTGTSTTGLADTGASSPSGIETGTNAGTSADKNTGPNTGAAGRTGSTSKDM